MEIIKYKVLRYKKNPNWYGVSEHTKGDVSLYFSETPQLFNETTTDQILETIYKGTRAYEQLDKYDLVDVNVQIVSQNGKDKKIKRKNLL